MNERGIRVSINSGLTEDEVYEVTRQIKILDGVAAVTLNHQEPHVGLVVLKPGANAAMIAESVRGVRGITGLDYAHMAA